MTKLEQVPRYGVKEQTVIDSAADFAAEQLRLAGFTIVDPGFSDDRKAELSERFDRVAAAYFDLNGGRRTLATVDEHNTVRAMLTLDRLFLDLATTPAITLLCEKMLGTSFILNQQNGIFNPAASERYNQAYYHRDLPYQHFVSSRPLALNALYCVDAFTIDNGATKVVPGSHKQEAFPSDQSIRALESIAVAPAGTFIVLDCMVYHSGGRNTTALDRRAVNHVYTLPFVKQQICFEDSMPDPEALTASEKRLLDIGNQPAASAIEYVAGRRKKLAVR